MENSQIKLSVIIPVYNQPELVLKAIESIPVRSDIEVLVIDDCSTDDTYTNLQNLCLNIRLFKNKVNSGPGVARNVGLNNARGEYIAFLDSDDYFDTDILNKIIDTNVLTTDLVFYDLVINNGNRWVSVRNGHIAIPYGAVKFIRRAFLGNLRFREVRLAEDALMWEDLISKNPTISYLGLPLLHYNYPREGSYDWNRTHGTFDREEKEKLKKVVSENNYRYNVDINFR